ncbi:hypothetical protein BGZ83_000152, partial [Gryganskiella cystojenkinii]
HCFAVKFVLAVAASDLAPAAASDPIPTATSDPVPAAVSDSIPDAVIGYRSTFAIRPCTRCSPNYVLSLEPSSVVVRKWTVLSPSLTPVLASYKLP